jgi:hypothetical protein
MCSIQNNSNQDMSALTNMAKQFYPYAQEYLGFDKPAQIVYQSDPANGQEPLGKTAQYNPSNYTVTLFVDGRHPKDLLRSLAHELVHHAQNCRGDLTPEKMGEMGDGYAQTDGHLRKMEQEAYASMVMRDWEDQYKSKRRNNLHETNYINKEIITMSEHEKLIQRIVAEVMKNVKVTTESEEDEDVKEEGQGDRKDSRDNNQQGHRQGNASDGSPGQNLEEGDDDDDAEVKEEGAAPNTAKHRTAGKTIEESDDEEDLDEAAKGSRQGGNRAKQQCEKQGKKMVAGKCVDMEEANEAVDNDDELDEAARGSQAGHGGRAKQQCEKQGKKMVAGKCVELDENLDDDETDDLSDLKETFQRRNNLLFEKLCRWSKK